MATIAKSIFSGADYVRLTAQDHRPYEAWHEALMPEFEEDERAGRRLHFRWIMGYYGRVSEHAFVGKGDQGTMVQCSGRLANVLMETLAAEGGKCTRIDLQVTVPALDTPDADLHTVYNDSRLCKHKNSRPPIVEINDTSYGAKMVTIGKRQSQVYGRIYDKFKESKADEYKGMVRYEIEVKQPQSVDLFNWLTMTSSGCYTIGHIVGQWFRERGVNVYWDQFEMTSPPDVKKRSKSDDSRLAWLQTQVAPTLLDLAARGKARQALEALLHNATQQDILLLREALSAIERGS